MDEHQHHEKLVNGFYKEQKDIFDSSDQAIFAYLDDNHKVCNRKFAELLGYNTPVEWGEIQESFLETFVAPKSQDLLTETYQNAIEKRIGATIKVTLKKKSGEAIDKTVILVPVIHKGHLFALHFISG